MPRRYNEDDPQDKRLARLAAIAQLYGAFQEPQQREANDQRSQALSMLGLLQQHSEAQERLGMEQQHWGEEERLGEQHWNAYEAHNKDEDSSRALQEYLALGVPLDEAQKLAAMPLAGRPGEYYNYEGKRDMPDAQEAIRTLYGTPNHDFAAAWPGIYAKYPAAFDTGQFNWSDPSLYAPATQTPQGDLPAALPPDPKGPVGSGVQWPTSAPTVHHDRLPPNDPHSTDLTNWIVRLYGKTKRGLRHLRKDMFGQPTQ